MKKQITIDVSDSSYKVVETLKGVIKAAKDALADGFQPGQDIPKVASENMMQLFTAITEVHNLPDEAKEDVEAFMKAWLVGAAEIGALFLKKEVAAPAPAPETTPAA